MTDQLAYSPSEVAERLGVHPQTILRWLHSGRLPGRKVGGIWLVSAERLHDWLTSQDAEVTGDGNAISQGERRPVGGRDQLRGTGPSLEGGPLRQDTQGSRRPPGRPAKARRASGGERPDDRWSVPPVVAGHRRKAKPEGIDLENV